MTGILRRLWSDYIQPLIRRPDRFQSAALCHRQRDGRTEILLITSRHTGRWILPKGWPIKGQDAAGTAALEAWEEAGVKVGRIGRTPLGSYRYRKRLRGGAEVACETKVYAIEVAGLSDDFREKSKRKRRWVTPEEAAKLVDEPDLRKLLATVPEQELARAL